MHFRPRVMAANLKNLVKTMRRFVNIAKIMQNWCRLNKEPIAIIMIICTTFAR